jgi:pimeloyl-ACP methyl ester carboxylesterase
MSSWRLRNPRWPFRNEPPVRRAEADALRIAYVERGPTDGWPVSRSHGFPYDVQAFDEAASILTRAGASILVPYSRGFGRREAL